MQDRMTAGPMIDYETLAQDAMRGVVRTVLTRAAKSGLPGDHHFYISFDTQAPGASLSKRLREKYPNEMTIVLQHRFWDLTVTDERFEVKLTFDGIPERLVVPFAAIKVFFDPSVRYGLQFEDAELAAGGEHALANGSQLQRDPLSGVPPAAHPITARSTSPRKPRVPRKPRSEKDAAASISASNAPSAPVAPPGSIGATASPSAAGESGPAPVPVLAKNTGSDNEKAQPETAAAKVVSLDAFRKK